MIEIPADPYPFPLDPGGTALVVIDMQRDFVEPGGFGATLGNDVALLQAVVPAVAALIALFRAQGWPVIHTRESHAPDLSDCPPSKRRRGGGDTRIGDPGRMGRILVRGEPGTGIVAACAPAEGELVVDKPGKGMFHATGMEAALRERGITHLVFAGVTTEVCVQTSMREANDRGFECLLVSDATESYFPEFKAATLRMIVAQGGIVGWVTSLAILAAGVARVRPAPFDPGAAIDALAPMLGLSIPPDQRAAVAANLRTAAAMADIVLDRPVGDRAEPAPVFRPEDRHG